MARRKLLLADDSITIQKVVNLTFADEGIEVITVGDGDSAAQRISEAPPDIILADVNMPGLTGYEVCERVRSDESTRHIPVILLVGVFEQFDDAEAARVGASAHLTKPFQSIRQLVNQVTDLIEASRPKSSPEPEPQTEFEPEQQAEAAAPTELPTVDPFNEPVATRLESFREDRIASIDHEHEGVTASGDVDIDGQISDSPEGEDIDRLYRQSIGEEPLPADDEFPDLGIDDEMIETSYTAPQPPADELDIPQDQPDFNNTVYQRPVETKVEEPQRVSFETTELSAGDLPEGIVQPPTPQKDQTIRLDPAMVEAKMAEENRRYEQETAPVPAPQTPIGEDTIRMDSRFDTRGSSTYEFDDTDLLDIPTGTEVEITSPVDAASRGGKQIVTLSPELIEMIAQRVVEKLAERH